KARFRFEEPGNYVITLTTTNQQGDRQTLTETVSVCTSSLPPRIDNPAPPKPVIALVPQTGPAPLSVTLDGSLSSATGGQIVDYRWSTSDGQRAFGHTASLVFPEEGAYTVRLSVTDGHGQMVTQQQTVTVTAPLQKAPVADFRVSPNSGSVPLEIALDATASHDPDGEITDYSWLVSNGETELTASGEMASLTLEAEGSYTVNLTVRDNEGLETTASDIVTLIEGLQDNAIAELNFVGLKPFYQVGERLVVDLQENLQVSSRFERVDLWLAIQLPSGHLLFKTDLALSAFSQKPQPFRSRLETAEEVHRVLEFELFEGLGGDYMLYALYVQEGKNPITDDFAVRRSELAIGKTRFANR
ncbi:MAG: PKD domain-containing protein, partial [Candidatus Parabeggiatoa sp.]|nr:PKD domain-containing protein [Candidatus Parabeggiatoa sp.]